MNDFGYWTKGILVAFFLLPSCWNVRAEITGDQGPAVGYLMDLKGSVVILRSGSNTATGASCIPLEKGDVVSLGGDGSATVLLPDRAYVIHKAGRYRIAEADVVEVKDVGETAVDPVLGTRGSPLLGGATEQVVMPPKMLFAAIKPPVMRAVSNTEVISPCGLTLSTTPDLVWTGNETNEYAVQVVPIVPGKEGNSLPMVKVAGCKLNWARTGWPSLRRDESYRVVIVWQGEVLTDAGHVFLVADAEVADKMTQKVAAIEKALPAGRARELAKASLLTNPDYCFYAEARLIVVSLLKGDPNNPIYLRLMQRCYAGMGSAQGFASVERRLCGEGPLPRNQ